MDLKPIYLIIIYSQSVPRFLPLLVLILSEVQLSTNFLPDMYFTYIHTNIDQDWNEQISRISNTFFIEFTAF